METTYIKRRSMEEIKTEDEIHLLSAKLDQTREDIRSMTSKLGTWEELKQISEDLKIREMEIDMKREIELQLQDIMEEKLKIIESNVNQRIDFMEMVITTKMREMGERICHALDRFTSDMREQHDPQDASGQHELGDTTWEPAHDHDPQDTTEQQELQDSPGHHEQPDPQDTQEQQELGDTTEQHELQISPWEPSHEPVPQDVPGQHSRDTGHEKGFARHGSRRDHRKR